MVHSWILCPNCHVNSTLSINSVFFTIKVPSQIIDSVLNTPSQLATCSNLSKWTSQQFSLVHSWILCPNLYEKVNHTAKPFYTAGLFLSPQKTSENQWFSDFFRGCRQRPEVWNGLKKKTVCLKIFKFKRVKNYFFKLPIFSSVQLVFLPEFILYPFLLYTHHNF